MTSTGPASAATEPAARSVDVLVVDTSAALAAILGEPEAPAIREALDQARERLMSAGTAIELGVVLEARLGAAGNAALERFLRDSRIELVDVDRSHVDRALTAWRRFGKGNHAARLNLGDLFAYALADAVGRCAILCVGDDFAATDLPVLPARHRDAATGRGDEPARTGHRRKTR